MSMESAVAFYERMEMVFDLHRKFKELGCKERVQPYLKNELVYDFTGEEMLKVVLDKNPEMTDGDLEEVTRGAHYPIFGEISAIITGF